MKATYSLSNENFKNVEETDSPWIRFDLDSPVSTKSKVYLNSTEAKTSPLGSKIFGFPWVEEIKITPQSILIKRQDWVDFDIIAEPLKELIEEHFKANTKPFEENPEPPSQKESPQNVVQDFSGKEKQVAAFLEETINPQIASHGGRISLVKLEDSSLFVKMEGGCQGCGMAQATLKEGVETSLKEHFDFISHVVDTTDHSQGLNPYL